MYITHAYMTGDRSCYVAVACIPDTIEKRIVANSVVASVLLNDFRRGRELVECNMFLLLGPYFTLL